MAETTNRSPVEAAVSAAKKPPSSRKYLLIAGLKLHPQWDSLRGDPRFEKIVALLAPKDVK